MRDVKVLSLFWPDTCPFCGKVWRGGACPACLAAVKRLEVKEPRCMQCGKPVRRAEEEYCRDCSHTYHHYDRGRSIWLHKSPVSNSIYRFKYQNQRNYGSYYANKMTECCNTFIRACNPYLIVPIPLHPARRRKRGYNQAEVLADCLGKLTDIRVDSKGLARIRSSSPQKLLGSRERKRNMQGAFAVTERFVPVPSILLVDDIYTTGNTIDAAAEILKKSGVQNVYFLTISIGQGY
ncbi:amidophosphoribosyltransferase [Lachnospiraceae bacterium]|uniref:ComF family protein n=1 Tax=Extibacter sp. GGCC_0201 TaxID=2731209 RepID=UPI001AA1AFB0|nr:ComF family protein [Extibacter sp. GGCC_0201]MBO1720528.1 ComF family protein [Extibacter sp. GGCC_0201]BDF38691.1 amidophosphoribosyltransferase [Lachnospiraceae bacterium]